SNRHNDETTVELDDILSQPITDSERLAAFLQRKAAENQKPKNDRVFANFTFDLDINVPLIKKIPKDAQPASKRVSETPPTDAKEEIPPQDTESDENLPPPKGAAEVTSPVGPAPLSPTHRRSLRRSGNVPGSDKLRRHAIRRRSQSCGRQLLKEFENAINVTHSSTSPMSFAPGVSSTPCQTDKIPTTAGDKTTDKAAETPTVSEPALAKSTNNQAVPEMQIKVEDRGSPVNLPNTIADLAVEVAQLREERISSFYNNIMQLDYTGRAPHSRPETPTSMSVSSKQKTYTIEKGPGPGQLLLSLSRIPRTPVKNAVVKVKRLGPEILAPDTPHLRPSGRQSEPGPEFVVPETQPQDLGELVQNLSRNASGPIVVINACSPKPKASAAALSPELAGHSSRAPLSPQLINASPRRTVAPPSPGLAAGHSSRAAISPQLIEASPARIVDPEQSVSRRISSRIVKNLDAIMTDDDSEEEQSAVALNLAPSGGNTTRLHRLRRANTVAMEERESSMQLLNLHQSINTRKKKTKPRITSVPLNKAPSAPINGEQFAEELVRMSNYEILDLRKRNSMGKLHPLNGHRNQSAEQQLVLEQKIQSELLRRKMLDRAEGFPCTPSSSSSENSADDEKTMPAPRALRATRSRQLAKASKTQTQRPSRSRRRDLPMTQELQSYLSIRETMNHRRRNSKNCTKRSLYTKGDSTVEDSETAVSPQKQARFSQSMGQIAPRTDFDEKIAIVPPPPASLRYSQSLRDLRCVIDSEDDILMAAPPEFHDDRNNDTLQIAPPPPGYNESSHHRNTIGHRSNMEEMVPPPVEFNTALEDVPQKRSESHGPNTTKRKSKINEMVPPPIQFDEVELVTPNPEFDNVVEEVQKRKSKSHGSNTLKQKSQIKEMVSPPPECNQSQLETRGESKHELTAKRISTSIRKVIPNKDSAQPNLTHNKTREEVAKSPKRRPTSSKKSLGNKNASNSHISEERDVKENLVSRKRSSVHDDNENLDAMEVENVNTDMEQSDHMDALRLGTLSPTSSEVSDDVPSTSRAERHSNHKKPPASSPSEMSDDVPSTSRAARHSDHTEPPAPSSAEMSDDEPSTIRAPQRSDQKELPSPPPSEMSDDVPSTSRAARQALQRSMKKSKKSEEKAAKENDDAVFKIPKAPAPRRKKKKPVNEVSRLGYYAQECLVSVSENDSNDTSLRRSKRGQVPLRNTWCHTIDEPKTLEFINRVAEAYGFVHPTSSERSRATSTNRSRTASKSKVAKNTVPNLGTLVSSTPRDPDKAPEPFPDSVSLGVAPLDWHDNAIHSDDHHEDAPSERKTKKRGRKKKEPSIQAGTAEMATQSDNDPEPMTTREVSSTCTQTPPTASPREEHEQASIQLINWLRGASNEPPSSTGEESGSETNASDLIFTDLEGIDYAFYKTKEKATLGYMRFKPHQARNKKRAKVYPLKFIVQFGEFSVQTEDTEGEGVNCILRVGDLVEVEKGTRYSIQNTLNDISVLMVIRN
ncbi:hypothetical protein KR009_004131, partial [Drosophila setifemur]